MLIICRPPLSKLCRRRFVDRKPASEGVTVFDNQELRVTCEVPITGKTIIHKEMYARSEVITRVNDNIQYLSLGHYRTSFRINPNKMHVVHVKCFISRAVKDASLTSVGT